MLFVNSSQDEAKHAGLFAFVVSVVTDGDISAGIRSVHETCGINLAATGNLFQLKKHKQHA